MSLYKGRCKKEDTNQLLDMLDDVFFAEDGGEPEIRFIELLPKLYKDEYEPAYNNVIVSEDGVIKAAVGCYPMEVRAAGRQLKVLGIGNVAVAKDSRRKGYMIDCMNMAIDMMKDGDYDYSVLGGQRQRYSHFGYEPSGCLYRFIVDSENIKRLLGEDASPAFEAREITPADGEIIKKIKALNESLPYYTVRSEAAYLDILKNWQSVPYAVFGGGEFKGYFCVGKNGKVQELKAKNAEDLLEIIMCVMRITGQNSVSLPVPVCETEECAYLAKISESSSVNMFERLNILNYGRFIEAFLAAKAQRVNLCSGTLKMLIHGFKRDETVEVTVDGATVRVSETQAEPDIELSHYEAINMLTGIYSKEKLSLPAFAQGWFPLDYYACGPDNV